MRQNPLSKDLTNSEYRLLSILFVDLWRKPVFIICLLFVFKNVFPARDSIAIKHHNECKHRWFLLVRIV